MTAAIRKQIERSRHKHAGSKRIEVVLDAGQLLDRFDAIPPAFQKQWNAMRDRK